MDRNCLHIPIDYAARPPFRLLEQSVGGPMANAAILSLWRELAYASETAPRVGFISGSQMGILAEDWRERIPGLVEKLVATGWLEGAEGGYFCAGFARDNQHLSPYKKTLAGLGGDGRALKLLRERTEIEAMKQQGLFQDEDIFQREDGTRMDGAERARVTLLIKLLDNCVERRPRLTSEFTAGLVASAARALASRTDEDIDRFARWLLGLRKNPHPSVPAHTESILEKFPALYGLFEELGG